MNAAIIVAGGSGERSGLAGGKQMAPLHGEPLMVRTARAFEMAASISAVVVVCHPERVDEYRMAVVDGTGLRKVVAVVPGGETRRLSVAAGLDALPKDAVTVAVHDGARPLVTPDVIDGAVEALLIRPDADGVVVGHPAYDTVKTVDGDRITGTPDRAGLWLVQTPQVFRTSALRRAHARAAVEGFEGTDDASLVERDGGTVLVREGPRWNVKVTMPEDLDVVEALSGLWEGDALMGEDRRVGLGYDVHAFADGRELVLGGVRIDHPRGLLGHSDADVLVHALMDAILGAMRAGDIGGLFPDTDPAYAGVSSIGLLAEVGALMRAEGWRLTDADTVLVLEEPRISPYRDAMRAAMAAALEVPVHSVGVKATTTEGLGLTGRREGVAAQAVVLLERVV